MTGRVCVHESVSQRIANHVGGQVAVLVWKRAYVSVRDSVSDRLLAPHVFRRVGRELR